MRGGPGFCRAPAAVSSWGMALSAFDEKACPPVAAEVARVLGEASGRWDELRAHVAATCPPVSEEWGFPGAKYGWSLRLRRKERILLYLTPQEGRFLAAVVLGDRAVAALPGSGVSAHVLSLFAAAKRYAEGTGIRLEIGPDDDLDDLRRLLFLKTAPDPGAATEQAPRRRPSPKPSPRRRG